MASVLAATSPSSSAWLAEQPTAPASQRDERSKESQRVLRRSATRRRPCTRYAEEQLHGALSGIPFWRSRGPVRVGGGRLVARTETRRTWARPWCQRRRAPAATAHPAGDEAVPVADPGDDPRPGSIRHGQPPRCRRRWSPPGPPGPPLHSPWGRSCARVAVTRVPGVSSASNIEEVVGVQADQRSVRGADLACLVVHQVEAYSSPSPSTTVDHRSVPCTEKPSTLIRRSHGDSPRSSVVASSTPVGVAVSGTFAATTSCSSWWRTGGATPGSVGSSATRYRSWSPARSGRSGRCRRPRPSRPR